VIAGEHLRPLPKLLAKGIRLVGVREDFAVQPAFRAGEFKTDCPEQLAADSLDQLEFLESLFQIGNRKMLLLPQRRNRCKSSTVARRTCRFVVVIAPDDSPVVPDVKSLLNELDRRQPQQTFGVFTEDLARRGRVRRQPPDAGQDLRAITRWTASNAVIAIAAEHQFVLMALNESPRMVFIPRQKIQARTRRHVAVHVRVIAQQPVRDAARVTLVFG